MSESIEPLSIRPNSVKRSSGSVSIEVVWPSRDPAWESLDAITRMQIRDHMDAVCDLVERRCSNG